MKSQSYSDGTYFICLRLFEPLWIKTFIMFMLKEVFGGFMSKPSRKFDLAFLESELKGKTLLVYWHLLKSPGLKVGVREVQRKLGFSSPSVAVYHLDKLMSLGLVEKTMTSTMCLSAKSKRAYYVFSRDLDVSSSHVTCSIPSGLPLCW